MKNVARGVVVLFLTFLAGLSANYVFDRVYIRFENVAVGSIALPPHGRGGFSSYRASDGVNLSFDHLDFPSAEEAREAYQQILVRSRKIIERAAVFDREGKFAVGERVIGMFSSEDGREWPLMICLDGPKLYEISSTSLRHIQLFEKAHRRY